MLYFILIYVHWQLTAMVNKNFPNWEPELAGKSKVITGLEELKHKKDCISLKRGIAENVNVKL